MRTFGVPLGPLPKQRAATNGIILRHGYIVAEFGDTKANDPVYSVAKSFLSTVCGLAVDRGLIRSVDDPVAKYIHDGGYDSPHNAAITWKHHLQQTSEWEGSLWGKNADFVGVEQFGNGKRQPRPIHDPAPGGARQPRPVVLAEPRARDGAVEVLQRAAPRLGADELDRAEVRQQPDVVAHAAQRQRKLARQLVRARDACVQQAEKPVTQRVGYGLEERLVQLARVPRSALVLQFSHGGPPTNLRLCTGKVIIRT